MQPGGTPEWFTASEAISRGVMQRIADAVGDLPMAPQVRSAPMLAQWFLLDTMTLANQVNRDGMHANVLALTRQYVESIGIIELGVCHHPEAEAILTSWDADKPRPGSFERGLRPLCGHSTEMDCGQNHGRSSCASSRARFNHTPTMGQVWRNGRFAYTACTLDRAMSGRASSR